MTQRERNKRLLKLVGDLVRKEDVESLELIKTMLENDTESMKHGFKLMTENSPIATFFGVENLSRLKD
jgi:hypothetical protein